MMLNMIPKNSKIKQNAVPRILQLLTKAMGKSVQRAKKINCHFSLYPVIESRSVVLLVLILFCSVTELEKAGSTDSAEAKIFQIIR